jgi:Tripartite tricarboxylate transporter TctB family
MSKADRDLLVACFVLALAVFSFYVSAAMETPRELIESPGIFPGLMSIILFIFGVAYFVRSILRGGRIRLTNLGRSVIPFFKSQENRPTLIGILFPAVYVFIAIPLIGFYISSALFMGVMFYLYVKRWRRWILLPVSIGITVTLYLVFTLFFQLQIW